mmetsp:Transcript_26870/g.61923  ORF Transcript_26870/g.61923 Transcript_26870/m.61923 type:complete len:157 (+) Transcript_26870:50-520(+)
MSDADLKAIDDRMAGLPTVCDHTFPVLLNSAPVEDAVKASPAWQIVTIKGSEFRHPETGGYNAVGTMRRHTDHTAVDANRRLLARRICESTGWRDVQVHTLYFDGQEVKDRHVFIMAAASKQGRPMIACAEGEQYDRAKWSSVQVVQAKAQCCVVQ